MGAQKEKKSLQIETWDVVSALEQIVGASA